MKKLNQILSVLVFALFVYFFVSNLIVELDLFYVMWGAILIPLPIAFLLLDETDRNRILSFLLPILLLLTVMLFAISYYSPSVDSIDFEPMPGPRFIDIILTFTFIATIATSFIVVITNYSKLSKKHVISYLIMIPAFVFCLLSFDKNRTLEYISGIVLFILISYSYCNILYSHLKNKL